MKQLNFDERRTVIIPGDFQQTVSFATTHWIEKANQAIAAHGFFAVALSGGSTPKAIFQQLSTQHTHSLDWSRVWLFWSDERSVPPTDSESNYHMAMVEGKLAQLPLLPEQIFRMQAEENIEAASLTYETLIRHKLPSLSFDLIMLGMGEDGHTASLFPHTQALTCTDRLVVANAVPQKKTHRMSFTFPLINKAHNICLYALGASKASMVKTVLTSPFDPQTYPAQQVGTLTHKALWLLDQEAAALII